MAAMLESFGFPGILSPDGCFNEHDPGLWRPECNAKFYGKVILRNHAARSDSLVRLGEIWWQTFMAYVKRDQLSLPFAIWKSGAIYRDLGMASRNMCGGVKWFPVFENTFARGGHR